MDVFLVDGRLTRLGWGWGVGGSFTPCPGTYGQSKKKKKWSRVSRGTAFLGDVFDGG